MNRGNYNDYNDSHGDYYRKRDRNTRDDDRYYNNESSSSTSRRERRRSRSRSRDGYNDTNNDDSWSSSNRDRNHDRRNRDRDRDSGRRNYDRRSDYRKTSNYDSDESDGGNSYSNEPNNKVIVRGLASHITEADIQCDLIQCGLKSLSIRLIRKKRTGESRGFAFVTFSTIDEARSWLEMKKGVLVLQDQYRAMIQYSFTKDSDGQYDKLPTDWYCNCGVFNFKRRENCFKCSASREESEKGGEGSDEISNILTKKIMFRNLDALTNEEKVLTALQEKIPEQVSKVAKILICRDPLTQISRGICYLNFDNLVDSMNTFQALEKLNGSLQIDSRDVTFSYCVDSENRNIGKPIVNQRRDNTSSQPTQVDQQSMYAATYQYTLADVPKLAEQAANMYAQNQTEKESYLQYYTEFYTKQISQGVNTSLPSQTQYEAHSGASIAQSAIERKHKMKTAEPAPPGAMFPTQQVETPKGNDGKKYPTPDTSSFTFDESSGYYYDASTNLYWDATSQYFFNSEINQFLYWDQLKSTYILAPSTSNGSNGTAQQTQPPPPPAEEKDNKKQKEPPQDKVKVAKKIVKDMEKWAKQLNQKKDYMPVSVQQQSRSDDSQSPPAPSYPAFEPGKAADVGFTILEKKDRSSLSQISTNASKLVMPYHSDSDENEDQAAHASIAAGNSLSEKDYVDFDKLTCMLCKRAFPSADVLSKHLKMSNLHKENLQKFKMTKGILEIGSAAQNYRDRAKERRLKYGEADPVPVNRSKERFHREMEKQASIVQTYQASTLASQPISEGNIGNKLLQKMGWKAGSGLGKSNQGRTEIIETEQRVSNAGLGSKSASFAAGPGDDYKTYIKKMMKKRYEEVE